MNKETGGPAFPTDYLATDPAMQGMTLRQYAAIKLKVPDSGTNWLDAMIVRSMQDDFAAKAMQGLTVAFPEWSSHEIARTAYLQAVDMREAR